MAKVTQYVCDGCGVIKGNTNHWWLARPSDDFLVKPFNEKDSSYAGVEIFCGDNCLHKALTKWSVGLGMAGQSLGSTSTVM